MNDLFSKQKIEIKIKECPIPMITSFAPMQDFDLSLVFDRKKELKVITRPVGKSRVSTSIQIGEAMQGVNWSIPGFKMHESERYTIWDNEKKSVSYFKNLRSQGRNDYKEYMIKLIHAFLKRDPVRYEQFEGEIAILWQDRVNVNWHKID